VAASLALLVVLLPVFIVVSVLVAVGMGFPVFFRQMRAGLGGKPFLMYKFRTMSDKRGGDGRLLPDSDRLSKLGGIMRATSIDELPELLNVVKGDMSLVGPRPLLTEYLGLYTSHQNRRHEVSPGITGWAQINGRNAISWEEKFDLDVWYVDNRSTWLDAKILLLTVAKVFRREGISQAGDATMPRFRGETRSAPDERE